MAKKASKPKKGVAGKNTGAKARKAIRKQVKKGSTLKQIGTATGRDDGTIGRIESGEIKNPPADLAAKVSKAKVTKKKKK